MTLKTRQGVASLESGVWSLETRAPLTFLLVGAKRHGPHFSVGTELTANQGRAQPLRVAKTNPTGRFQPPAARSRPGPSQGSSVCAKSRWLYCT